MRILYLETVALMGAISVAAVALLVALPVPSPKSALVICAGWALGVAWAGRRWERGGHGQG